MATRWKDPTSRQGPTAGGTAVQILGANFTGTTAVTFGGKAAKSFTIASDSEIDARAPVRAAGTVNITVTNSAGTSVISGNDEYTFFDTPDITGLDTTSGPAAGGTTVAIFGDNLKGATAVALRRQGGHLIHGHLRHRGRCRKPRRRRGDREYPGHDA
jgi:hypothetical protein